MYYIYKKEEAGIPRDGFGRTPSHLAAMKGDTKALRYLGELEADLEDKDYFGMTPAHCAAKNGHTKALRCLEELGADLNARDHEDRTPASHAAEHGHFETLNVLIENKVKLNAQDINGETPLDMVYKYFNITYGHYRLEEIKEIINPLKKAGAKTGRELRKEKEQEDTFERAGKVCDRGNKEHKED